MRIDQTWTDGRSPVYWVMNPTMGWWALWSNDAACGGDGEPRGLPEEAGTSWESHRRGSLTSGSFGARMASRRGAAGLEAESRLGDDGGTRALRCGTRWRLQSAVALSTKEQHAHGGARRGACGAKGAGSNVCFSTKSCWIRLTRRTWTHETTSGVDGFGLAGTSDRMRGRLRVGGWFGQWAGWTTYSQRWDVLRGAGLHSEGGGMLNIQINFLSIPGNFPLTPKDQTSKLQNMKFLMSTILQSW
jgi:hypothetical protein